MHRGTSSDAYRRECDQVGVRLPGIGCSRTVRSGERATLVGSGDRVRHQHVHVGVLHQSYALNAGLFSREYSKKHVGPRVFTGTDGSALGGIRTPDLLIRSQMLYPAELRAQFSKSKFELYWLAETVGFEPTNALRRYFLSREAPSTWLGHVSRRSEASGWRQSRDRGSASVGGGRARDARDWIRQ